MKKRLKSVLAYLLCIALIPSFTLFTFAADNGDFEVSEVAGGVYIKSYKGGESAVTVPDTVNGKTVLGVDNDAFAGDTIIESITFSSNSVKIGNGAFSGCVNLKNVDFGSVNSIGAYAFENCALLDSIEFSNGSIGYGAFINCTSLGNIDFDGIVSMGRYALHNTKWYNENENSMMYLGNVLYLCKAENEAVIENGITLIADGAFMSSAVSSVYIPDTVKSVGKYAFADCKNLTSLMVPSSVESVDDFGIGYKASLTGGYEINPGFKVYCSGNTYISGYCEEKEIDYEITDGCTHDEVKKFVMTKTPDCVNAGEFTYICLKCHYIEKYEIPAKGHKFGDWAEKSKLSCTTDFTEQRICSECKFAETRTVQKAEGHKWSDWYVAKNESCTEDGELQRICSECQSVDSKIIKALGHTYSDWVVISEPTCAKEGEKQCYCEICGDNQTQVIPVTDEHSWGEWTVVKNAEPDKPGEKSRACSVCMKIQTEPVEYVDFSSKLVLCEKSDIVINEEKHIAKIKNTVTVEEFCGQFESNENSGILVINMTTRDMINNSENVVTGYAIVLVKDDNIVDYYNIAVTGDCDGNGKISTADARVVLRSVAKLNTLDDTFYVSADVNNDGNVNTKDARSILRVVAKLDKF